MLYAFLTGEYWPFVDFGRKEALQTSTRVTIRQFDHLFLFVFITHYVFKMHRLKVTPSFFIVEKDEM
jgi:hypothetical protein